MKERDYREGEEKENHQDEPKGVVDQELFFHHFYVFSLRVKVDCTHLRQDCDCENVLIYHQNRRCMHTEHNNNRIHIVHIRLHYIILRYIVCEKLEIKPSNVKFLKFKPPSII